MASNWIRSIWYSSYLVINGLCGTGRLEGVGVGGEVLSGSDIIVRRDHKLKAVVRIKELQTASAIESNVLIDPLHWVQVVLLVACMFKRSSTDTFKRSLVCDLWTLQQCA
jgi:hypothetical protein